MADRRDEVLRIAGSFRKLGDWQGDREDLRRLAGAYLVEAVKLGAFAGAKYIELRHLINMPETSLEKQSDWASSMVEALGDPANRAVWWLKRNKILPTLQGEDSGMWFPDSLYQLADLIEGEANAQPASPPVPSQGRASGQEAISKEAKAIALLLQHPDWSDQQIAEAAGCSRTSLYRWSKFVAARALLKKGRDRLPKGQKDAERGTTEAWDERTDDE
ncbi:MAG TPA: helix-turn-helix domain-containing protein [Tepidisphaeraceae bacterium]|nr:helix-turn-helix domain-containing protein [Tepidisphaeraceae bacterium]